MGAELVDLAGCVVWMDGRNGIGWEIGDWALPWRVPSAGATLSGPAAASVTVTCIWACFDEGGY